MLSEAEGCAVLQRVFEAHGYAIELDVPFSEGPVAFSCDGWDAQARVGFEYMTEEAGDHEQLDAEALEQIAKWVQAGQLYLFIVDEADVKDEAELVDAATLFLQRVQAQRQP